MEEQLISFETAKLAKEKGFEQLTIMKWFENCDKNVYKVYNCTHRNEYWTEICNANTQSLLQKWIREVHKINIEIYYHCYSFIENKTFYRSLVLFYNTERNNIEGVHAFRDGKNEFDSYEECLECALYESLKLIK